MEVADQHGAIYWVIIINAIPMIKRHLVVDLRCVFRSCLSGIELKNFYGEVLLISFHIALLYWDGIVQKLLQQTQIRSQRCAFRLLCNVNIFVLVIKTDVLVL